jgi:hypothetical protein
MKAVQTAEIEIVRDSLRRMKTKLELQGSISQFDRQELQRMIDKLQELLVRDQSVA